MPYIRELRAAIWNPDKLNSIDWEDKHDAKYQVHIVEEPGHLKLRLIKPYPPVNWSDPFFAMLKEQFPSITLKSEDRVINDDVVGNTNWSGRPIKRYKLKSHFLLLDDIDAIKFKLIYGS